MKSIFLSIVVILSFLTIQLESMAQPSYQVIETAKVLMKSWQNSYTINIIGAHATDVADAWSLKMQKAGGIRFENSGSDAIAFKNVLLPDISSQPLAIFFKTYEDTEANSTNLIVWFRLGDKFISSRTIPSSFGPISRSLISFSFELEDQLKKSNQKEDINKTNQEYPNSKN